MQQALNANDTFELREYLSVLRNRKWTILLVTAVVAGVAMFVSFRQVPQYAASARLLVLGVPTDSTGFTAIPNLETEAQIVASEVVANRVIEDLDLDLSTQALIQGLAVSPATEVGEVLTLLYRSSDPQIARDIPNSFALNYIQYKKEQAEASLESGAQAINSQISAVQERLRTVTARIQSPSVRGNTPLVNTLEVERQTLIARLGVLQQRLDDFEARRPIEISGGQVIEAATLPTAPYSPNHVGNGLRAVVLGLALGIGLAFLRERLDDRLRGRQDLEHAVGVPVLAIVPKFTTASKTAREIIVISQPRGSASEAYRSLRTGINFLSSQQEVHSLLVTSPSEGEGKTVSCVNLAVAFAQSGRRVMLISGDLRRPTLEEYFGLGQADGLSTWLISQDREPWGLILDPGIDNLRVIPSGPIPPNPAELLSTPRLTELVEILENNSDIVLVDSPPVLAVADAAILSTHVDGTLLVVNAEKTHKSAAMQAAQELQRVGAGLLGTVYNSYEDSLSSYGGQYYLGADPSRSISEGVETSTETRKKSRLSFRR